MKTRKAAVAALISTYKDNYNSEPIQADTQKARKAIALEVRQKADGYVVRTYPLRDRRVVYRLERINTDYNLFSGQEAADHE